MAKVCMIEFGTSKFLTRVDREAKTLAAAGHHVLLLAIKNKETPLLEEREGYVVRRVRLRSRRLARWAVLRFLKATEIFTRMLWRGWRYKSDVYDVRDLEPLAVGWLLTKLRRAKLIYSSDQLCLDRQGMSERSPVVSGLYAAYERFFIRRADVVIVTDRCHARQIEERYPDVRPIIVRNVSEIVKPMPKKASLPELDDRRLRVLIYQGILAPDRGLEEMVRALEELEDCALLIVGSGPLAGELTLLAEDLRVADRVIVHDPMPFEKLLRFTTAADAGMVLTQDSCRSDYLAVPKKFYEYLMLGVPVVASDFPEMRAVVTKYHVGVLVDDPSDPHCIARAVRGMFADRDAYQKMRKNARRVALERLNWDVERKGLLVAFDRVLGDKT